MIKPKQYVVALVSLNFKTLQEAEAFAKSERRHGSYRPLIVKLSPLGPLAVARELDGDELGQWVTAGGSGALKRVLVIEAKDIVNGS